jgi:hypothetical protein
MGPALIVLITVNLLLFSGLSAWAWRYATKETSPRLRLLSRGLSVVSLAFVLGAATRLAGVAVELGWLPGRVAEFIPSNWHLLQSLAALALGFGGSQWPAVWAHRCGRPTGSPAPSPNISWAALIWRDST